MNKELVVYLREFGYLMHKSFAATIKTEFNINKREFILLNILNSENYQPSSQKELSDMIHADRSTMVALVDSLEQQDLIERVQNPNNRRENQIMITSKGKKLLKKIETSYNIAMVSLFDDVEEEDLQVLYKVLRIVVGDIDESNI